MNIKNSTCFLLSVTPETRVWSLKRQNSIFGSSVLRPWRVYVVQSASHAWKNIRLDAENLVRSNHARQFCAETEERMFNYPLPG